MKITKTRLYLILILALAFVLRLLAAHHTHVSTDEMIYSIIPLNIISSGQLGTIEQSPLFFYLTDIGYQLLGGITAISIRFFSIIFGSLAVLVVYLFSRELWENKKAGLLAGFLFALSGYSLLNNTEMDMIAFFFSLLSMLCFVYYLKRGAAKDFYFFLIFLVLAILVKNIVLLFLPAYALVFLVYWRKNGKNFNPENKGNNSKIIRSLIIGLLITLILVSPVLIYNYFTYQEKGKTDYYFSYILGIGKPFHEEMEGKPWELPRFLTVLKGLFTQLWRKDTLILFGGVLGIILVFCRMNEKEEVNNRHCQNKYPAPLLILSVLFLVGYIAGQTGSSTHFLWLPLVLSIFAGGAWVSMAEKMETKFNFKHLLPLVVIAALLISFLVMQDIVASRKESITLELRDYVRKNIPDEALVVIDPRIYRGIHAWVFNDKHYLEGTNFAGLVQQINFLPGEVREVKIFYVECGEGTNCGWKPEDFQRIYPAGEEISVFFRERLELVKEIRAGHNFNIYRGNVDLPNSAYEIIDQSHQFWFYPVGWKYPEQAVDYYPVQGFDWLLNGFGRLVLWLEVVLALLAIPFVLCLGLNGKEGREGN